MFIGEVEAQACKAMLQNVAECQYEMKSGLRMVAAEKFRRHSACLSLQRTEVMSFLNRL